MSTGDVAPVARESVNNHKKTPAAQSTYVYARTYKQRYTADMTVMMRTARRLREFVHAMETDRPMVCFQRVLRHRELKVSTSPCYVPSFATGRARIWTENDDKKLAR